MAFWTEQNAQPKRNYRFRVVISAFDTDAVWWAKSFKPPSYEVSEATHDHLDNKFYFPGRVTWGDCSMTLVDPAGTGAEGVDAVSLTNTIIENSGYVVKGKNATAETINRNDAASVGLVGVSIQILNAAGDAIETWTLNNPFIKSVSFSDLAYDNDELRTIDIAFRYDWATCEVDGQTQFNPPPTPDA